MKTNKRIDFHHHITPAGYVEKLKEINITESMGVKFPKWTPETSLSYMKKNGIAKGVVSVTAPGVYFPDQKDFSLEITHWCNNYLADLKQQFPDKFGAFACIPLGFVAESVDVLAYALDELRLDGVCLFPHYGGTYLGDSSYESFFKALNARKALVFIHPSDPSEELDAHLQEEGIPNALIEAPFETTRAIANLMASGTLDRYPDIRFILPHGGGAIPYLAWRLAMIEYGQKGKKSPVLRTMYDFLTKGGPEKGLKLLRQMYYDTALTSGEHTLNTLLEFAGSSRIVFGTDFPMAKVAPVVSRNLDRHPAFSADDLERIYSKNAGGLLNGIPKQNHN